MANPKSIAFSCLLAFEMIIIIAFHVLYTEAFHSQQASRALLRYSTFSPAFSTGGRVLVVNSSPCILKSTSLEGEDATNKTSAAKNQLLNEQANKWKAEAARMRLEAEQLESEMTASKIENSKSNEKSRDNDDDDAGDDDDDNYSLTTPTLKAPLTVKEAYREGTGTKPL